MTNPEPLDSSGPIVTLMNTDACFTFCSTAAGSASSVRAARAAPVTTRAAISRRRMSSPDFLLLGLDLLLHRILRRERSGHFRGSGHGEHGQRLVGRDEVGHGKAGQLPLENGEDLLA